MNTQKLKNIIINNEDLFIDFYIDNCLDDFDRYQREEILESILVSNNMYDILLNDIGEQNIIDICHYHNIKY